MPRGDRSGCAAPLCPNLRNPSFPLLPMPRVRKTDTNKDYAEGRRLEPRVLAPGSLGLWNGRRGGCEFWLAHDLDAVVGEAGVEVMPSFSMTRRERRLAGWATEMRRGKPKAANPGATTAGAGSGRTARAPDS